jgi:hypothetical protein
MGMARAGTVLAVISLGISLNIGVAFAQTDSAPAEDTTTTTTVPNVPVGANLTPPVGVTPPLIQHPAGTGQSGTSSVSMAPGTLTSGVAREDENAVHRAPASEPASEPAPESAPAPSVNTCADYPTWYDAQIALESSVDPALISSLDPDGNAIACEDIMYPGS